ncbi:hypothetical protein [Paludisphaera mucosa]|uniref:Uncharacterized protein n=1 Tax=Paludisphaera mucosa TaxID=3030827 RepID=A0ABT6FFB5_9BACT|nr:hypothetical protein [Paludisphaera mucosa]MDG3006270.1 hypothetical protein [Paludisphaera mucosa]
MLELAFMAAAWIGQAGAPPLPESTLPATTADSPLSQAMDEAGVAEQPVAVSASPVAAPAAPPTYFDPSYAPAATAAADAAFQERRPFESDHAFDGFVGPMTDPIQAKDARSLTEARLVFLGNWARPGTPVIGSGTYQVYALQLRLALTERLQIFADKDGIVRFSPKPGRSVTGLANIAAGAKYVFIRDVENQFLFSGAVQYEAPTGYANIYQNQGSGLLGVYGIFAKQFGDSFHVSGQFGQNIAMQNQLNGYFYTHLHTDYRIGKFVPFFEANWFYYNQSSHYLPASVGMEGAGYIDLGTSGFTGNSIVTLAPGMKYNFSKHLEFGLCYQFPVSPDHKSLYGDQVIADLIWRY